MLTFSVARGRTFCIPTKIDILFREAHNFFSVPKFRNIQFDLVWIKEIF